MARPPAAKKKKAPAKKAVPDKPTIVNVHDLSADANRKAFADSAAATRSHLSTAMEAPACEWLSNNITHMVMTLGFQAGRDKPKISQLAKLSKGLITGGWTNTALGGMTQWVFKRGEVALGPAKVEKAIKPAQAVANVFFALADSLAAESEEDPLGGGGDGDDNEQDEIPLRGAREDDGLPFENQEFADFLDNGAATEVPDFVAGVNNNFLRAEPGLQQRATDFGRGLAQPSDHRLASGSLEGFRTTFDGRTHDITEARVIQEDVVTGAMFSVKTGATRSHIGLLQLYNDELDRLMSIGHTDAESVRMYLKWYSEKALHYSNRCDTQQIVKALLDHDQKFRCCLAVALLTTFCCILAVALLTTFCHVALTTT